MPNLNHRLARCCKGLSLLLLVAAFTVKAQLLSDIKALSDISMQGRETGTAGAAMAAGYISQRYAGLQLAAFMPEYLHPFSYGRNRVGTNLAGWIKGCRWPQSFIVVTAHYDHLGRLGSKIFHGADDNASGVAAMLELADRLSGSCPSYSYIFVATDAEEKGLYGSKAFVADPPVPLHSIVLNLNLDMISRPDRHGALYLTGAKRYPELVSLLAGQPLRIRFLSARGPPRSAREPGRHNWHNVSDHGAFHRAGIPYLFFGGQDHPDYHTPEDTWHNIRQDFLDAAMEAIWQTVLWLELQPPKP
ncbi:M28 family peptidase [Chromatiaceae bacterium AAb-1]|nr:M28 family peptidase [Chromatiaceae bacterium AAb-1]